MSEGERAEPSGYVIVDRDGKPVPVERTGPTSSEMWIHRAERASEDALEACAREIVNWCGYGTEHPRAVAKALEIMRLRGLRGPEKSPELRAAELRADAALLAARTTQEERP